MRNMISLELAKFEDIPIFTEIELSEDTRDFVIPYTTEQHLEYFKEGNFSYLKILQSEDIVGFIILVVEEGVNSIEFRRIAISPSARGIGKLAISEMEKYCSIYMNKDEIWLDVFEFNERAIHIYRSLGYSQFGNSEYKNEKLLLFRKKL